MSIGAFIRILECVVTIFCGVRLAVRPCPMRWNARAVKVIFWVLVAAGMAYESANTFWFKFSAIHTLQVAIYLFGICLIFYYVYFWQLLVHTFLYWFSIMIVRNFIVSVCAILNSEDVITYISTGDGQSWHWLHIISMLATMTVVFWLWYAKREKELIRCRYKRGYILFSIPILTVNILEEMFFSGENFAGKVKGNYLFICALVFWGVASLLMLFLIYNNYKEVSYHDRISRLNVDTLQKQYEILSEMYTQKRRQVHDAKYHDIVVSRYLREGEVDKALEYLDEKMDRADSIRTNRYCGIPVIDMMLNYKLDKAQKYDIKVDLDIDAYFCPIEDTEMSVILGNLLDNAIEAVRDLPKEQRRIYVSMLTPNSMFLLQIKNPYRGKRKRVGQHYMTTKEDKEMHGLGMGSVELIVNKYDGSMEIKDSGTEFTVDIGIYQNFRQKIYV